MDITICAHCQDKFISSHVSYRPKTKLLKHEDGAPEVLWYCSDSCLCGYDPKLSDPMGHNIRTLNISQGIGAEKLCCLTCMKVFPIDSIIRKEAQNV